MKKIIQYALAAFGLISAALGAEREIIWTSTKDLFRPFGEIITLDEREIKFKAHDSGERFFYSIDGQAKELVAYAQEIALPIGSSLELSGKHINIKVEAVKEDSKVILLSQKKMDNRSLGKDVVLSRAGASIDDKGKMMDTDRTKTEMLFGNRKLFAVE